MAINENLSPIPLICTLNTTILDEKFLYTSPVFQENLHCTLKRTKIIYSKILKSYPLAKKRSMEISVLFHSCAHLTLPFWIKIIPENFSSFPGKFALYTKITYRKILKSYPLAKWPSMEISILFHKYVYLIPPLWPKRFPENISSFPGKSTLCTKMAKN